MTAGPCIPEAATPYVVAELERLCKVLHVDQETADRYWPRGSWMSVKREGAEDVLRFLGDRIAELRAELDPQGGES